MMLVRHPYGPRWRDLCRPLAPWLSLWRQRRLIWHLALRDVRARYHVSLLGPLWSLLTPALAILVYTFVFNTLLRPRWGSELAASGFDFALLLMTGLFLFNVFSEIVARTPHLIYTQPHFVKKVAFPLEVFPAAALLAALVHLCFGLAVVLLLWCIRHGGVPADLWLLPAIVAPYTLMLLGLGWLLAAGGTFLRDLAPTLAAAAQLLMFLTPVFYPLAAVPPAYRPWLLLNPLAVVVEGGRAALAPSAVLPSYALGLLCLASLASLYAGYVGFMALKPKLADVV